MSLALWLRAGRAERGLSLDDVSRVTKIQPRILERLEGGSVHAGDGLPAEVFVRGFIRSYAKCCGLDESEALSRYRAALEGQQISPAPTAPGTLAAPPAARAVVSAMADLAPQIARTTSQISAPLATGSLPGIQIPPVSEPVAAVAVEPEPDAAEPAAIETVASTPAAPARASKKKRRGAKRAKRKSLATGTPSAPMPVVAAVDERAEATTADAVTPARAETMTADAMTPTTAATADAATPPARGEAATTPARAEAMTADADAAPTDPVVTAATADAMTPATDAATTVASALDATTADVIVDHLDPLVEPPPAEVTGDAIATAVGGTWQPRMPAPVAASVPWRRPAYVAKATAVPAVPTLVIDDADPEHAAQLLEEREEARGVLTNAQRRSFLPPALLDREDRGARQGGLTLAVIILLIAATLTLSYLMRRPSSSGDGVTARDTETQLIG